MECQNQIIRKDGSIICNLCPGEPTLSRRITKRERERQRVPIWAGRFCLVGEGDRTADTCSHFNVQTSHPIEW